MSEPVEHPDIDYSRSTRRLFVLTVAIGFVGSAIAWVVWGGPGAAGFGIGSAASFLNLWLWHGLTLRLSGEGDRRARFASTFFVGRILVLFAIGYVILRTLNVQPLAAILGLFTSAIAAMAEILIELALMGRRTSK